MSRIIVHLDEIRCIDTEDTAGRDEPYVIGAVKTSDRRTSEGFATRPLKINDGQTMKFGPGGGYIFDKQLPEAGLFQLEMVALEADTAKTAKNYQQIKKAINQALAIAKNPRVSAVGSLTLEAADSVVNLDKDDELGAKIHSLAVSQISHGWNRFRWKLKEDGMGWSTWNYEIKYWIGKF